MEAGRGSSAEWQAADWARRGAQADDGHAEPRREIAGRLYGRFIYYVGPVDPVRDEVVGPAGPTTATRMDKFTRQMLAETGLLGMVGKAERGPAAIEAIKEFGAVYLMAVGGAAYLVSKAIIRSRLLAFDDLGMEAHLRVRGARHAGDGGRGFKGNERAPDGAGGVAERIAGIPILQ